MTTRTALLLGLLLLCGPALAAQVSVNYTGNNTTLEGSYSWEAIQSADLTLTPTGSGSAPEIWANGSKVWSFAPYNKSLSASYATLEASYPNSSTQGGAWIVGCTGCSDGAYRNVRLFVASPSAGCSGNLSVSIRPFGGWNLPAGNLSAAAYSTNETVSLANVTWANQPNYSASPFWVGNLSPLVQVTLQLPQNSTAIVVRRANEGIVQGYVEGVASPSVSGQVTTFCEPQTVHLSGHGLPLKINGSANFTASGSVTTDRVKVWPYYRADGVNQTGNMTFAVDSTTLELESEKWGWAKAGSATIAPKSGGCQVTTQVTEGWVGCSWVTATPTPTPVQQAAGGGAAPQSFAAPVAEPIQTPAPATAPKSEVVWTPPPSPTPTPTPTSEPTPVVSSVSGETTTPQTSTSTLSALWAPGPVGLPVWVWMVSTIASISGGAYVGWRLRGRKP